MLAMPWEAWSPMEGMQRGGEVLLLVANIRIQFKPGKSVRRDLPGLSLAWWG